MTKMSHVRIPAEYREQIAAELGTMSDQALADKWSPICGVAIEKHTIFWMRKRRGIVAKNQKQYRKAAFTGRLEDAHPEVREMFGKLPITVIADHFGVSRTCVRFAGYRLGFKEPRRIKFDAKAVAAEARRALKAKKSRRGKRG